MNLGSDAVEGAIRSLALSRGNALLAGSDHWAIATLIKSCKPCAINSNDWLTQMLIMLPAGHSESRSGDLMPSSAVA